MRDALASRTNRFFLVPYMLFRHLLQEIHPICPQKRLILHNDPCLDLQESIDIDILKFYTIFCIHLSITSFFKQYVIVTYIVEVK